MKEYIILGSNNFWYATDTSLKDAKATIKAIRKDHSGFADDETGQEPEMPKEFFIFEAIEV